MNDHLISNCKKRTILNLFFTLLIGITYYYFFQPIEWAILIFAVTAGVYNSLRRSILLGIVVDQQDITIENYNFLKGKKKFKPTQDELLGLDFYGNDISLKYKRGNVSLTKTYQITAEPWNDLYGQIKKLKLKIQELEIENN